jgi:DNA polymerase-3 subunit epsilon
VPGETRRVASVCQVLDTLALAREMHPGQRNSLDALAKRYEVDNSQRELHGALLDARILADVYLAMTGGQGALALADAAAPMRAAEGARPARVLVRTGADLIVLPASDEETRAHESMLALIARASGGRCLWPAGDGGVVAAGAQRSSA